MFPGTRCVFTQGHHSRVRPKENKLRGLSPRANYTDRETAACRRSGCQLLRNINIKKAYMSHPLSRNRTSGTNGREPVMLQAVINFGTTLWWVFSFALQPLYPQNPLYSLHRPRSQCRRGNKKKTSGLIPRANYTNQAYTSLRWS
jgi:hypothetical protein